MADEGLVHRRPASSVSTTCHSGVDSSIAEDTTIEQAGFHLHLDWELRFMRLFKRLRTDG